MENGNYIEKTSFLRQQICTIGSVLCCGVFPREVFKGCKFVGLGYDGVFEVVVWIAIAADVPLCVTRWMHCS